MADKRISQLIERVDIANNDVLPIVASGATTTNKVTISTIQDWMQSNLDVGVTSVGLTMPSAFQVSGSPITTSGNITVTAAGTASQYIRGDGTLADFPQGGGGGGASVSYYLNGSVSQGTIGGIAYLEMNKTPILGAGTDFTIAADGYIASFITDAGDPALLQIPAGNWNFETYLQASSGGGTPTFYIELYKVDSGGTATLIASNSGTPESISLGTNINPYFSAIAVPQTTLLVTDRLAIRIYVTAAGRTITLHTENSHLCQIITTFTTGLTALNGLTAQVQNFATGTSGTDFNISSTGSIHTFNLPDASASNRGAVTTGTQTFAGYKIFNGTIGVNNDLQLATVGTALNTFIKNINSTGLTSIGSNGFGFNNANNIYFSGSNKGGGVFAFSNTGTQIYTLPNASGTISLTSDLGAYLPLSGGTMTGAINGISANFTSNLSSDSGVYSNTAFFAKHNPGSTVTVNGWNAMQGDANTFIVLNSTKGMRINFPSNASFTHTLPDASGTIALTSNLSSYLPLSGGTLTGALNGTSASFSGNGLFGGSSAVSGLAGGISVNGSTNSGINFRIADTLRGYAYVAANGSMNFESTSGNIVLSPNGNPALTIAASTGAATFSSKVNLTEGIQITSFESNLHTINGTLSYYSPTNAVYLNGAGASGWLRLNAAGTENDRNSINIFGSTASSPNSISFRTNNNTALTIGSSGAATFSSSVTATRLITTNGQNTLANSSNLSYIGKGDNTFFSGFNFQGVAASDMFFGRAANSDDLIISQSGIVSPREIIRFTQGGNVGIGTASPSDFIDASLGLAIISTSGRSGLSLGSTQSSADEVLGRLSFTNTNSTNAGSKRLAYISGIRGTTNNSAYLEFATANDGLGTQRMVISQTGNVGIGTASPTPFLNPNSRTLAINSTGANPAELAITGQNSNVYLGNGANASYLYSTGNFPLIFGTNGTERMRISSNGGVQSTPAVGFNAFNAVVSGTSIAYLSNLASTNDVSGYWQVAGNFAGSISHPTSTTTNYNVTSDYRLKENIMPLENGLDAILKLKPITANYINDENKINIPMFLAHEVQEVIPIAVTGEKDAMKIDKITGEETIDIQQLDASKIIPHMVKAIQELKAEIEALKSQING